MKYLSGIIILITMTFGLTSCAQNTKKEKVEKRVELSQKDLSKYSKAVFASGCFWHTEALFDGMKGVAEAVSGYAGGNTKNPSYEKVITGNTGHAESVMVYYDSTIVSYSTLMKAYFEAQDPTSVNGQGADRGSQYRSLAFYNNSEQKEMLENYIKELNESGRYTDPIAVQVVPYDKFWKAEDYHQEYVLNNPNSSYVQNVCIKDVRKFQKKFPELIKPEYMF
ncbi:MAG: peptide-methionine (S)-S-oxide reductase MsrA [Ginsengibacter sp.]